MEKKKSELGMKARKEVADFILANEMELAKNLVEKIIRLVTKFGLLKQCFGSGSDYLVWIRSEHQDPEHRLIGMYS